jgi:6-pyruvoyltetrahydropterin/6-carboxytetrahydropterin synthase
MLLTVSKRLEFSASRRLYDAKLGASENAARYGSESGARYGTGRNYVAWFIFSGTPDASTGMLINISEIKERVGRVLQEGFDHKFLNEDNAAFADVVPTPENVARELFARSQPLFQDSPARLVVCHLQESEVRSATVYADGRTEANYWFEFSAARQTMSSRLTSAENEKLFGHAASHFGHGHNYRARLTFLDDAQTSGALLPEIARVLRSLHAELDHKNLNREVPGLRDRAMTTESLACYIHERAADVAPVHRVRLHERDDFFAECWQDERYFLGMQRVFHAAHRLHAPALSDAQNAELFGSCNNPRGHGHRYLVEATIRGDYDKRSGTLYDFHAMEQALAASLQPWEDKHLDLETPEFRDQPSTGENIVQALWPRLDANLRGHLTRLRIWETANNRFTLRRTDGA